MGVKRTGGELAKQQQTRLTIDEAYSQAVEHCNGQRYAEADRLCTAIIQAVPKHIDAINLLGIIAQRLNYHEMAVTQFQRALEIVDNPLLYFNLGISFNKLGRQGAAITALQSALTKDPGNTQISEYLQNILNAQKAASAVASGQTAAEKAFAQAVELHQAGRYGDAIRCYQQVVSLQPEHSNALFNMGSALQRLQKLPEAVVCYQKVLTIDANFTAAYSNLGVALKELGDLDAAIESYQKAINSNPEFAEAYNNLGIILKEQGKLLKALDAYQKAIAIKPDYAEALSNMAAVYKKQGMSQKAVANLKKALASNPDFPEALNNLGALYKEQGKLVTAKICYQKAITLKPDYAEALSNMAALLQAQGTLDIALINYLQAARLKPGNLFYISEALHLTLHMGAWEKFAEQYLQLQRLFTTGNNGLSPFVFLSLPSTPQQQLQCAQRFIDARVATQESLQYGYCYEQKPERLKIGYLSCDLQNHAIARLTVELLELHDRHAFTVMVYSHGRDDGKKMRQRIVAASDYFIDIATMDHRQAAEKILADGVHILVDLNGYTKGLRPEILNLRPAPIQVNWLGFPGTMGAGFMDYIISDPFITPPEYEQHFSEKIFRLPNCYQPNDRKRQIAENKPSRKECNLPKKGLVFANFNQTCKISPQIFKVWMALLRNSADSTLWLLASNPWAVENLRQEAERAAIDGGRIIFAPKLPLSEHLARYQLVDLVLDTFPYTSHTTGSDALWAGCPLLTMAGDTFASRVAGSLLHNVGMDELITYSLEEYEALGLELANNPKRLADLRKKLKSNLPSAPLFDTPTFTKNLEAAFVEMWQQFKAD